MTITLKPTPAPAGTPVWLRTSQVAAMLGCSGRTVRRMIARGELRAMRLGDEGHWRIPRLEVERFLEMRRVSHSAELAAS
jgi:excisionase family DNA binding protein